MRWRRWLARLGIATLLVQSLAAATPPPTAMAASPFADPAAWCGMPMPADLDIPGAPSKSSHRIAPCTLCQTLNAAASGLAPAEFTVLAPQSDTPSIVIENTLPPNDRADYLAAPPRAPPSFV